MLRGQVQAGFIDSWVSLEAMVAFPEDLVLSANVSFTVFTPAFPEGAKREQWPDKRMGNRTRFYSR